MTALVLSLLLLTYIVIPGIIIRRLISYFVPLRKAQWSRSEEITSAVIGSILPFVAAIVLVKYCYWCGHHPFAFDDNQALRWNDYKMVFSASYSEKLYESFLSNSNDAFWQAALRVVKRQSRMVMWFYTVSIVQAVVIGLVTSFYGDIRKYGPVNFVAKKTILPSISEWHFILTPFSSPRKPKRYVQVDVLTTNELLYRGTIGDFHLDRDGALTGILLHDACRFDRKKYDSDRADKKQKAVDDYWRKISGHSFYLLGDKILNLNVTHVPDVPLEGLAEQTLKSKNIDATVTIATKGPTTAAPAEEPDKQAQTTESSTICPHCSRAIQRQRSDVPVVFRSDGKTYHLALILAQERPGTALRALGAVICLAHFRYDLDVLAIRDRSVIVAIRAQQDEKSPKELLEVVANELAKILATGRPLEHVYEYAHDELKDYRGKNPA